MLNQAIALNPNRTESYISLARFFMKQDKAAEATSLGVELFLPKPYTAEKLLKALARVLGADAKE